MDQAALKSNTTQRIAMSDERRLERYFGPLEGVFRRSTFGAMIDRLDAGRHFSKPCRRCGGVGFNGEDVIASTRSLRRLEEQRRAATGDAQAWERYRERALECNPRCVACRGVGAVPVRGRGLSTHWSRYSFCRFERDGKGCHVAVTLDARPRKGAEPGYPADPFAMHSVLVEYAKMSRDLDRVAELDGRVVSGLEIYYGDEGAVWGRTRHGRMFALYRLTRAAGQILKHGQQENPTDLGVSARLATEAELDRQQPKAWRRQLLNAADEQARRIYDRMCQVWNRARVSSPSDWRDRYRDLLEAIEDRRNDDGPRPRPARLEQTGDDPERAA